MSRAAAQGWRGPALVLAAGALTLTVSLGIRHAFGLFLEPMSRDNGWTREVFAFAIALQNLVWGAAQPFAGRLADRHGAGRAVLGGSVLYVAGLLLMATAHGASTLAVSAGVLVGLGLSGTSYPIVFGAISRCTAPERRSLATGIAMAVGSLGQFAMLPGALAAIDAVGWAGALVALAGLGATMAPLSAALRERPAAAGAAGAPGAGAREALAAALRHRGFWLLSFGFFVCGFHVVFIATHLPAFLADRGLGPRAGAAVLALVGLFNIGGSYCAGLLGGRMSKPGLLVGLYLLRAAVIAAFVLAPVTEGSAYAFGAAMGFLWLSTVPLTNGTIATLFGTRHLAMLGGVVFFFHQVGAFLGGWLGGRIYVATGSYDVVWWLSIALALLAALVNVPVREAPVARPAAAPEAAA
ncbi:MFS transporter [Anaeromyxobacter sp. PSR-1]|uniref:MFS transporter n=1 Tax=unclassified Anaeromyxobacter TaxID=2620896 RepID=UPI0005E3334A|nr:MFS transporter [Anaeromyxobacter sp. PSR-1]GAO01696.1 putative MFS-type transporter YbfB [Anaeromyxobacter sp. PSR-1]